MATGARDSEYDALDGRESGQKRIAARGKDSADGCRSNIMTNVTCIQEATGAQPTTTHSRGRA